MMKKFTKAIVMPLLCIMALPSLLSLSQNVAAADKGELFQILKNKDHEIFNNGFNKCEISLFKKHLHINMEFYHDKSGITKSKAQFIDNLKNGLCNKEHKDKTGYVTTRRLIKDSLEIFPLFNNGQLYGAVQRGNHEFYEQSNKFEKRRVSTAQFIHLWILQNDKWKLSRLISFDHQSVKNP